MAIKLDIDVYDFKLILGFFWKTANGQWKGVMRENIEQEQLQVIKKDGVILFIEQEKAAPDA